MDMCFNENDFITSFGKVYGKIPICKFTSYINSSLLTLVLKKKKDDLENLKQKFLLDNKNNENDTCKIDKSHDMLKQELILLEEINELQNSKIEFLININKISGENYNQLLLKNVLIKLSVLGIAGFSVIYTFSR